MTESEKLPEDRKGVFRGEAVYILGRHPLPMFFALVYLIDRRKFPSPEAALAYLEELDKQQSWEEPGEDEKKAQVIDQIAQLARGVDTEPEEV